MSWFDKAIANAGVDKRDDYGEQAIEREQQAKQEAADYDTAWNYIKHGDVAGLSDYTDRNYNYRDIPFLGQIVGHASDAATQGIADFAQFVGAEGVGNYLNDAAQRGEEYLPPMSKPELSWNYVSDPNGMASAFGSVVGSMLPIGAAAYLAPVGGLTAAAANAASKVPLMGGLLSASAPHAIRWGLTGPVEAAMEAGSGERDMREQGMSNEEARQKSWDIFKKNAALLAATNAVEGAALPHIFKGITKAAQNGSRLAGAGRFAGAAATETGMNALEEGEQQGIQNSVTDKPYSINPLNWSDDQIEAAEFGVAGTLPFALAGLPATIRGMRRNDNPMQNDALEAARAAVEQPAEDVSAYIDEEPANQMAETPTASRGYKIDGDNSLDGFDSRYVSKWESAPGATDLASVRPEVKSAFNGLAAEYGDGLTLTGGAEKGYHAGGADGHEGGWKLDVDKSSVKDKDSFLTLCAKYGFKVGDEGDHYDLSANPNGGVGGQVVATPDTYAGSNGGQREGNENAWAVYDVFRGAGYSNEAIAGILGRVQQEHNFDTSNVPEHEEEGMHVGGYGMFQWNGGRTTAFKEWAEANNLDPQDARVQAQYALQEAQERGLTPEKMNQLSAEEAADLWTDEWEVGKRGNERQFANEWLGRIKSGGRSEASDINLPNYDDSSSNERGEQLAADQRSWDKVAERGREEENPEKPETQEELVNQAKERAVDAGDMDKTAEIITAQRSGDTKKLAEIAEKERKEKAKEAKGKEAPKAPKIEQKTPVTDALRRRAQKANMAAQMNDDTTAMYQIARALSQNDGAELNRIADKMGIPADVAPAMATDSMVGKTREMVDRARDAGVKFNEKMVEQTLAQRDDESVTKLYNYAQKELAVLPPQTAQKAAENVQIATHEETPAQGEKEPAQAKPATISNTEQAQQPQYMNGVTAAQMQKAYADAMADVSGSKDERAKQGRALITVANGTDVKIPEALKVNLRNGVEGAIKRTQDIINQESGITPPVVENAGAEPSAQPTVPNTEQIQPAVAEQQPTKEETTQPQKHNTITDLQKTVKGTGRKALTKALEAGYKPVDGENAIESPEGEKYYLNEAATKAFAKDYEAKLAKETPITEKEPEKAEAEQEQAKPERKLHRVRRGREEIAAVAKKYENGEISAKEAYSQVSAIAKDTATVPKDGLPNVTYIDGKMKLDLTDYGNRLIDETTVSKQEKPAETANTTVTNNDTEEVATNEQPRTGESTDGGHENVESRESRENEPARAGEVSGRDGREGTRVYESGDGENATGLGQPSGVRAGTELEETAGKGDNKRGNQPTVSLTEAEAHPSPTETPGHNYEIKDTDVSTKSEKVRFKQNVDAIKLLKQLETDDRMPTPAEQEILGAYNGWGGLKGAFLDNNEMNKELRELLTDDEYKAARSTINDAFYTPPKIIRAIWEGVSHLGFKGGRVLDPSMGVGNFFGTMPRAIMDKSMLRGVEIDSLTSRFGKMLYPNAFVENKGFQNAGAADNFYDLVISNIPFGQSKIDGYQIHNYFFANGMDKVRPGGLMVYITSQGSLAGGKDAVRMRNYLNKEADLIAAYKLPSGVFSDAGTQVATDIVVFRKHDADGKKSPYAQKFTDVKPVESGSGFYTRKLYDINEYFDKHPENILGETSAGKDQWGNPALNVKMTDGTTIADVAGDLESAMKKLPGDVYAPANHKKAKAFDPAAASKRAMADENTRDYEYYFKDGEPVQNQNGKETPLTGKKAKIVGDYIKLKNTLNALFAAESDPKAANKDVEGLRKRLNKDYDAFVAKHGQLTGTAASSFSDDPSAGMVQALEKPIEETYTDKRGNERKRVVGAEKADIFTTRSIKPVQEVTHVESADDALIASLTNHGGVDVDYMAKLMNSKPEQVIFKLKGKLFQNPVTEEYETRDEYLSGNVREKLAQAKEAAKENKAYESNVKELEKVIPEDLVSDEIYVNLGTPWIPVQDVQAFVDSLADNITVKFSRGAALWNVSGWGSSAKYKLKGITFGELLDHVLNNKAIQIYDGRGDDKVFNQEKTDAANVAAEELQQDFKDWIWKDKEREKRLVKYYNDNYNNMVVRQYDGQHLNLHNYGMNAKINLKPHQKDVVWRMLQGGNTLIAHCVGAGKTFEMQAAGMEMRRLGIANKPMYCLPNNVVEQFAREFRVLYPNAKLLVLQSKDLPAVERTVKVEKTDDGRTKKTDLLKGMSEDKKSKIMEKRTARNRMLNRIRTEDWDGIIISHNLFERFPVTPETAADFIQQQIDNLENTIREAKADKSMDSRALSNLENAKKNLEDRLDDAISTDVDDIGVPFEELGIDQLFVDEADMFKNLEFATRLGNIRGLTNSKAKRSQDMFLKTQWLTNNMDGRGVVFATGTPVSNTMSELYTMMRYLDMKGLKEKGLEVFDNWMRTFGDIGQGIERKPTGDGFRKVTKIKRFINMAELTKMFRKFADVKVQDELNLDIPNLKEGKATVVALDPDPAVVDYIKNVVPKRVSKMKSGFKKEKGEDNMLALTNDLRKLSLTDGKIDACADAIVKKYKDTADVKGAQLVFCDMGIPKAEKDTVSDNDSKVASIESPEVYRTLISKLKKKGIPEKDIAFIQNYNTKEKRDAIFQKVDKGDIRVLIGSTETMGAGTNCQHHLVALHDLDAPWRPRDLEQRHGRILRQGNENKEVEIFNYVVKDSFDANMWEKLKNKAAIIQQAMSGDMNVRTVEDADLVTLSYAEVEGAATGNPLIKEQLQVQNDLTKYQHAQTAFRKKVRDAENVLDGHEERIAEQEKVIGKIEKDIAARKDTSGDNFSMLVGNKGYKERAKAQEALEKILKVFNRHQAMDIGKIGGFRLSAVYDDAEGVKLQLVNNCAYRVQTNSVRGIENALQKAPDAALETRKGNLKSYKKEIAQAKEIVEQENPYAAKVKELSDRLNQLNREIESTLVDDGKQKVAQAEDTAVDSEPETKAEEATKEEKPVVKETVATEQEVKENAPADKSTANVEVDEFEHTKTGKMIPAARLRDNVPKDFRKQATAIAKNHGGKWSPFAKRILFKTEQGRDDFVREVEALLSVTKPESSADIKLSVAWHGTPHDFDTFSLDHIGAGEGAQVHGWGLYFAQDRKISEARYRDRLSDGRTAKKTYMDGKEYDPRTSEGVLVEQAANILEHHNGDRASAIKSVEDIIKKHEQTDTFFDDLPGFDEEDKSLKRNRTILKYLKESKELYNKKGTLFQVEIPNSDVLLDEQKPFSEQSEKVQKALRKLISESETAKKRTAFAEQIYESNGKKIYGIVTGIAEGDAPRNANFDNTQRLGSELLNKYGIKGITYEGGQDGRCFVAFDDQAVEIINKFSATGEIRRAIERATVVDNDDLTPQQRKMSEFGKEMGTPILWIDTDPNMHGYHVPDGTTVLNVRSKMPLSQVFWHEAFHWIANNNAKLYRDITAYFKGKDAFSADQLEAYRKRIGRPEMSDELTIEEMLADNFEEVKNRVKIFKEMGAEQPSLARKFVAWAKRIIDKFAEFFHNPEGKLTTSQRDSFVKAFGRLARDMKDSNGRPLFKVYKEGKEIKLPSGQLVTDGIKLSGKNDVDSETKVGDNETKRKVREFHSQFDENSQRMFAEKGYSLDDIADTYNAVMEAMDGVAAKIDNAKTHTELDEIRDNIKPIRVKLMDFNFASAEEDKEQAAIDLRIAREVFENANRGSEARSRVEKEAPPSQKRSRSARNKLSARQELNGGRSKGIPESAYSVNGYLLKTPNNKHEANDYYVEMREGYAPEASANFNTTNEKHSEKGAFSYGKTKYSYSASDNSNEGLFHKIKNIMSGKANEDSEKFRYRKHLTEMIEKALDVKLRYGKMDGKKDVVYKPESRVLRSRHAFDWENILPVAGRIAAEKLGIKNPSEKMCNYIADWVLTGAPNNVSKEADTFHKAMREHPADSARLEDLRVAFAEWIGKDYREQMQGTIQWKNKDKTTWKQRMKNFYEGYVEELEPINRMVKQVNANLTEKGQKKLGIAADPMIAFRMLRGSYGKAIAAIEGVNDSAVDALKHTFPNVDFTGFKTLYQILKSINAFQNAEKQRDFVTYCTACHIMDMHQHNDDIRQEQQHLKNKIEKLGTSKEDEKEKEKYEADIEKLSNELMPIPAAYSKDNCQKYINDGYDKYHDAQQDLVHFSNTTAAILADSGVISEKRFQELLSKWQNYVPMFRVFEDNEDISFGDSMKHIKGSTRDIVNPLESIIRNTAQFIQKAELNKAKCLLADVARCDASGWLLEEVDKSNSDKTTITFWENGKRKHLQTDPAVVQAVNNMGAFHIDAFIKVIYAITRLGRMCFTMASPEFGARNLARDWQDASLYTKYGVWISPVEIAKGFMHAMRRDDVYYEWLTQGAAQASMFSLDRDYTQETLDKMGRGYWKRLTSKKFFHALGEGLQKFGEYSEYGTRIAMYQKTKNAVLKDKPNVTKQELHEAMLEAAFESRDLMDFARHGKAGASWNKWAMFANASIQGLDKLHRSLDFKNDPKRATRVAAKLVLQGALPTIILFALYHDDDWYKEAPNWLKETHWLFKFGDTIIRVPKASDMGIRFISNAVEKGLDEFFNKHPHKAKEYFLPIWDALPGLMPTAILPMAENWANYSFFTDRAIVPQSQEKLPAKLQYGPYTTSFAKWVGEKFDVAPSKVDHFIAGHTGSLGMALPKAYDLVSGKKQLSLSLEEMPLIRGYLYPKFKSPQSVNDYYEKLNEQTKLKNEYKLTHKRPEGFDPALLQRLENAQKQLRKISKQEKNIIDSEKWSISDKETMQRNIQKKRIEIAKRALGEK